MINRINPTSASNFNKEEQKPNQGNNPQHQGQNQDHSGNNGDEFATILEQLTQEQENGHTNTATTQERSHTDTIRGGLGNNSTADSQTLPQPKTISILGSGDSTPYNASSARIRDQISRRGEEASRRSSELAQTGKELEGIHRKADGFSTEEANKLINIEISYDNQIALSQLILQHRLKAQSEPTLVNTTQAIKAYKEALGNIAALSDSTQIAEKASQQDNSQSKDSTLTTTTHTKKPNKSPQHRR